HTLFERDAIGRLIAKLNSDAQQRFTYDDGDRLLSIERQPTGIGKQLGITEEKLEYAYDLLGRLTKEITPAGTLGYEYDPLSNLTTLTLPDGRKVNHLYYGSGHLHQLNLDGLVISDMERDDLHREVYRTQGKLTSCFGYDAMGRKAWQFASTLSADKLSQVHNTGVNTSLLVEHAYNPIHRRYQYDPAGELVRTLDKLRGEIKYEYEANGQLRSRDTGSLVGSEEFRYDPAANRLDFNARQFDKVKDNRIKQWRDQEYRYDPWGNLIEKRSGHSKLQSFSYDCENRLVRAETLVNGKLESQGEYRYDSLGRRIAKQAEINGEVEQKRFLWQGLRMLREETPGQSILYLYEPGSYAPLARVDQVEGEGQKIYYFHTDQIGTPLELTDSNGKIVWQATYRSWGSVEHLPVSKVEQNLRFQGQYFDCESDLHYNTFRFYDPEVGRFVNQDPIGLLGGANLYSYGVNPISWIDPWGWSAKPSHSPDVAKWLDKGGSVHMEVEGRTWVYKDWEGNVVRYPDGHPDFTPFERQQVDVPDLKGNHGKNPGGDFGKADALAPQGKADYSKNTWHHHENMKTMQEVPKKIHNRFTHSGGVKNMKSSC
ncbi:RHS repeat-associated core domain-containing protein, partial [Pseudomonas putida]